VAVAATVVVPCCHWHQLIKEGKPLKTFHDNPYPNHVSNRVPPEPVFPVVEVVMATAGMVTF
jgi:hypothetical protein